MRKHRALIDRAFVGHFADVERRRFGEQDGAADAGGRAAARLRQRVEEARESAHARIGQQRRDGSIRREIGRKLAAGIEIGKNQRGDFVAVGAGQHHVAHQRREMRDERRAQRPDADPGAGRKLEILGEAAVEQQALGRIGRIVELERVADLVKALVVKSVRGERRRRQ